MPVADADDVERMWNVEARNLWDLAHADDAGERPPFRDADAKRLTYSELVFDLLNEGLLSLAGISPPTDVEAYGGFDLRRGDVDPIAVAGEVRWTYGGDPQVRTAGDETPLPAFIVELRTDLRAVGYGPLLDGDDAIPGPVDGMTNRKFGPWLEAAVREFQVYAHMPMVARFGAPQELPAGVPNPSVATSLVPQPNDQPYSGPICGVLNAETRALVKMWVERDWHCPVVVEARVLDDAARTALREPDSGADRRSIVWSRPIDPAHQVIWRRDQVTDTTLTFIAWDHTGWYPVPAGRLATDPVAIAGFKAAGDGNWAARSPSPGTTAGGRRRSGRTRSSPRSPTRMTGPCSRRCGRRSGSSARSPRWSRWASSTG